MAQTIAICKFPPHLLARLYKRFTSPPSLDNPHSNGVMVSNSPFFQIYPLNPRELAFFHFFLMSVLVVEATPSLAVPVGAWVTTVEHRVAPFKILWSYAARFTSWLLILPAPAVRIPSANIWRPLSPAGAKVCTINSGLSWIRYPRSTCTAALAGNLISWLA